MATIVISSISLGLSTLIALVAAYRRVRPTKFRVVYAEADASGLQKHAPNEPRNLKTLFCDVVAIGGGFARTIVDARIATNIVTTPGYKLPSDTVDFVRETRDPTNYILIPADSVMKFRLTVDEPGAIVLQDSEALDCTLELDTAVARYNVHFRMVKVRGTDRFQYWAGQDLSRSTDADAS